MAPAPRPAVTVIVPFAGSPRHAAETLRAMQRLELGPDDRVVLADNNAAAGGAGDGAGTFSGVVLPAGHSVVPAPDQRSSYYARNVAAAGSETEWLLFCDSDCVPGADLIERYLGTPIDAGVGIVAGGVVPLAESEGPGSAATRWARSRGAIDERFHLDTGPRPAGVTANLLVRRAAWSGVGGFREGIRSGGDVEFCWRVQEAGWGFDHRPRAVVAHRDRDDVAGMLAKARRHGAGRAWVNRIFPGALPRPPLARPLLRGPLVASWWLLRGDRERAALKLLDIRWALALLAGYWLDDNRAPGRDKPVSGRRASGRGRAR
jgi:GT2 family glycosyltransferase